MESINYLIDQAKISVSDLEEYVFTNFQERYFNLKIITEKMNDQIAKILSTVKKANIDDSYIINAEEDLNFIISTCNKLVELYSHNYVTLELKDDGSFKVIIKEQNEKETENIFKFDEFNQLEKDLDSIYAETEMPKNDIDFNAEKITDLLSDLNEIQDTKLNDESTSSNNITTTNGNDFNNDLDIEAITAFLNGNSISDNGLTV